MAATALVCDDAAFARDLIGDALEGAGLIVLARVGTADAVVAEAAARRPDVILLDLVLPDRSGLAALEEIRRAEPEARVIVCTALSERGVTAEALRLGAREVLVKPVPPTRVIEAVRRVLA